MGYALHKSIAFVFVLWLRLTLMISCIMAEALDMTGKAIEMAGRPIDWDAALRVLDRAWRAGEILRRDYVDRRSILARCAEKARATGRE